MPLDKKQKQNIANELPAQKKIDGLKVKALMKTCIPGVIVFLPEAEINTPANADRRERAHCGSQFEGVIPP